MYIEQIPKPFLDDILSNRCIPFVGAGFSKNAVLDSKDKMPLWDEMASSIAQLIPGHKYIGALDAISSFEHQFTRVKLIEELRSLLYIDSARPGPAHTSFCSLPFEMICTTNFDFLLESGYTMSGRICRPVLDEDQLSINIPSSVVTLFKFHGDLHHPSRMILTEEDYSSFISKYPLIATYIANLLISKTAWFIGYSLEDTDFRLIWQVVHDRLGRLRRPAYTIQVDCPPYDVARFERRGVRVINIKSEGKEYGTILSDLFIELREYWNNKSAEKGASIEEDVFAELALPKDANSRLCLFITPKEVTNFYRRNIFPSIEQFGFIPYFVEDLLRPGDSLVAKLSAIIQKSEYIIVDISSRLSTIESKIVFAQVSNREKLLIIKDENSELPSDFSNRLYFTRQDDLIDSSDFVNNIILWFKEQSNTIKDKLNDEPKRLIEKREYRAAVISAIALLEIRLRQSPLFSDEKFTNLSLLQMIRSSRFSKVPKAVDIYEDIRDWIHIRNKAIHEAHAIDKETAETIVNGTYELLDFLPD